MNGTSRWVAYSLVLNIFLGLFFSVLNSMPVCLGAQDNDKAKPQTGPYDKSEIDLKAIPFKIIYETYRETDGKENWELFIMNADGSNTTNLTQTKDLDEMYPHASPDGTKICFVVDEGTGSNKIRNVYYMNIDGTDRVKIADNARQPCWSPDVLARSSSGKYFFDFV